MWTNEPTVNGFYWIFYMTDKVYRRLVVCEVRLVDGEWYYNDTRWEPIRSDLRFWGPLPNPDELPEE